MPETVDTVVIGAGQAGLCASYELRRRGRDHLVLEKGRVAERWRSQRWDSFTLVTPNWTLRLPDHPYDRDPDGFLPRDAVVRYLESFAEDVDPPLRTGVEVRRVGAGRGGSRFRLDTSDGPLEADQVVVAVGTFQRPRIPAGVDRLPDTIRQVPAADYRLPEALPEGAVLVVGSGQSGTQIARELNDAGRRVYLSVGGAPRLPRRYRGADLFVWVDRLGMFRRTVDALDDPSERFSPNPHVSGREGGRDVNLHAFARDGVRLLGRFRGARDGRARRTATGRKRRRSSIWKPPASAAWCGPPATPGTSRGWTCRCSTTSATPFRSVASLRFPGSTSWDSTGCTPSPRASCT